MTVEFVVATLSDRRHHKTIGEIAADIFLTGYSGYTIVQIASAAAHAISVDHPNVILLHAGTNDMNQSPPSGGSYADAPQRLGSLIDQCIRGSSDAAILVAQIISAADAGTESRINTFNDAIPGVVAQRTNAGHHVMVVDMRSITTEYLADGLHPNDVGYQKMADLWFAAIKSADAKGWIKPPVGADPVQISKSQRPPNLQCSPGSNVQRQTCSGDPVWYNPASSGKIASGVGHGGDGKFYNNWVRQGQVASGIFLNGSNVRFVCLLAFF